MSIGFDNLKILGQIILYPAVDDEVDEMEVHHSLTSTKPSILHLVFFHYFLLPLFPLPPSHSNTTHGTGTKQNKSIK
jgi:hypothetical protein